MKPRIKIPASFVQSNPESDVCKIHVIMQDGITDKIPPYTIKAKHFQRYNGPNYTGDYLEEFYFDQTPDEIPKGVSFTGDLGKDWAYNSRGTCEVDITWRNCADIQVEWLGHCDMWLDYVKVENDVADRLLKGNDQEFEGWINDEVDAVNIEPYVVNFYIELFEFNNIPCMAYVNQKIDYYSGGKIGLMADLLCYYQFHLPESQRGTIVTPEKLKSMFFDRTGFNQVFVGDPYPLNAAFPPACSSEENTQYSRIPITLNAPQSDRILANSVPPANYDAWLQNWIDTLSTLYEGGTINWDESKPLPLRGDFRYLMQHGNQMSKLCDIPFIAMLQAHQWVRGGEVDREPTNEELNLMTNLAVSYGAKGILFWQYPYFDYGICNHCYGLIYQNGQPCTTNVYGQAKWDNFLQITQRLNTWGPTLMSFDNKKTSSYIYRLIAERSELKNSTYFENVFTYKHGEGTPPDCTDNPPPSSGLLRECEEDRYVQVATFEPSDRVQDPYSQYFMIVNRRCSPYLDESSDDHRGGIRRIFVEFYANHGAFEHFNSWDIIDVRNPTVHKSFDKRYSQIIDLGQDFMPSEGKLYKIVPTAQHGGNLVCDENITGQEFTCLDTVYNNEHNITIGSGTTIHFTDSSKIIMNEGTFQMGSPTYNGPCNISIGAASGNHWKGFDFNNCTVKIYNTSFSGLNNDTNYAINIIDCPYVDIQKNTFNCNDNYTGAVNLTYYSISSIDNAYIGGNTVNSNYSAIPAFNILSYAGITIPLIVENITFISSSALGSTAIMLSGITGGVIKNNTFDHYEKSINALSSSLDISGNTITSDVSSSKAISGLAGTELKMNNSGNLYLGGMNTISYTGGSSYDMFVDNSYFLLDNGENIFDIASGSSSYDLKGSFPISGGMSTYATFNCFKIDGAPSPPPVKDVVWGEGGTEQVNFTFEPYLTGCSTDEGGDFVIYLGGGINDTISERVGGGGMMVLTPKQMYDSICIQMRYRNYVYVKTRCMDLINLYPDSIMSLNAIPKLYLSLTASDTSQTGISALKTYYENLILNHTTNTSLVNRCNYFVQKCKVRLRQYSAALAGFQQIINENPYSFEALVAKWDYMATHLLDSLSAGGESNEGDDPHDKFTKEQRKVINISISTALQDAKKKEEKKIEELSLLADAGNSLASAQLQVKKTLKEVTRPQTPHNIIEHVKIVNNDIQKVFGNPNRKKENRNNVIPKEFRLSQNYPNPFNPTTKIQYDLPKDVKVKLIIYDMLGREVIRLVNNEFKQAGRYTVEFKGNNYASGVYFYRIDAGDFVQSKKMVLVK